MKFFKKIVSADRSQASVGTAKLFGKFLQKESAAKERTIIFARPFLPYRANGSAICLPLSSGTVQLYHKNGMAMLRHSLIHRSSTVTVRVFYGGVTV